MKEKIIIGYSIVSPLHLINFLAYLKSCETDFHEKYIFLSNYWNNSIIPKRYIDYCKENNINVIFHQDEKKIILNLVFERKLKISFVCVKNPSLYILKKGLTNNIEKIIIIDEGLSSYAGFMHSLKASFREKGIKGGGSFLIYMYILKFLKLFNQHKICNFAAFYGTDINSVYKKYFLEVLNDINISSLSDQIDQKSILFCTQPLIEVGLMSYDQYEKMLAKVMSVCENNKIILLIKKHPADNIFIYSGYNIIEFDGIAEELIMNKKNIIGTISSCSTSSLLISAFINKESFIFSFDSLINMDANLMKLFKKYCKSFEKIKNIK